MHNLNSRGYALYEKLPAQKRDTRVTVPIGGVKKGATFSRVGASWGWRKCRGTITDPAHGRATVLGRRNHTQRQ